MADPRPATFRTEFGASVKIMIAVAAAAVPTALILFITGMVSAMAFVIVAVIAISILLTVVISGYLTHYTFGTDALEIQCYLAFKEPPVKYSAVRKIVVKREFAYVLGFSTRCVAIYYTEKKYVAISPKNREDFVRALKMRCPQATVVYENGK